MRKIGLSLLLIMAILLVPGFCLGEMYVGAYVGPNFVASQDVRFEFGKNVDVVRTATNVGTDPSVIFGGNIGYWFSNEGFLGFNYPKWMKYLGFSLDVSYHRLNWPNQNVNVTPINMRFDIRSDAWAMTTAFMFMARYGFLPDKDVPFGRLQPYLGIGPIIFLTNTSMNTTPPPRHTRHQGPEGDLGFVVESGLRYLVLKRVSVFSAFRYRHVKAHATNDDAIFDLRHRYFEIRPIYNLFSLIFGVAYHF